MCHYTKHAKFRVSSVFVTTSFAFLKTNHLLKRTFSERKKFALMGRKVFAFKIIPFLVGRQNNERVTSPESLSIPLTFI